MKPIFSETYLSNYLDQFTLSSIADVRGKTLVLNALIGEFRSGKLALLKEEEIKSRFITSFFGDVLGFNYGNSGKWLLREEKKTVVDGTKPDAALGFFFQDRKKDDVRVVIEMKDVNTNLDEKKRRSNDNRSAVDQAFDYSSKMGGNCKWVIVSNMKEIRFYPSLDRSKCQTFLLDELSKEEKLKELLFLFHKDRFIKEQGYSNTDILFDRIKNGGGNVDRPLHILDRIYTMLKGFEGLRYVDPKFIANVAPFNILDDYVWHFEGHTLLTLNPLIYDLLKNVTFHEGEIDTSEELRAELERAGVVDANVKFIHCFEFLRNCQVTHIRAVKDYQRIEDRNKNTIGFSTRHFFGGRDEEEVLTFEIDLGKTPDACDCVSCNYRAFEYSKLIKKLKAGEGDEDFDNLEYAYGNYLLATNNYKSAYLIYKRIEKNTKRKEGEAVKYFLAKKNIKGLFKPIRHYDGSDKSRINNDIKSIDLDKVIYDEVEFEVSRPVKDYLIEIKEDALVYEVQDEIDDGFNQVERLKRYYDGQAKRPNGVVGVADLINNYLRLYFHVHGNYLAIENHGRYKYLCEKMFHGLVLSSLTPGKEVKEIKSFFLTEAILHIASPNLKEILDDVELIPTSTECKADLTNRLNSYLISYYSEGIFGDPDIAPEVAEQLTNYEFKSRLNQFFSNFFAILSRMDLSAEQTRKVVRSLRSFLLVEDQLFWFDLMELGRFLKGSNGKHFAPQELEDLLRIFIDRDKPNINKYHTLISSIAETLGNHYPDYKLTDKVMVEMALLKCRSEKEVRVDYGRILEVAAICDDACKDKCFAAFEESLDKKFSGEFYEQLLRRTDFGLDRKSYFEEYVKYVNTARGKNTIRYGKFTDLIYINFIFLVLEKKISHRKEFDVLTNVNNFERWLLAPHKFDYSKFELQWLLDLQGTDIIDSLKGIEPLGKLVGDELQKKFDVVLAEIYARIKE